MPQASEAFLPSDPVRALRHLASGHGLASAKRSARKISPVSAGDVVWALIEEAVEVMDRLPDREKAWLRIGSTAAGFSANGFTKREILALEQLRYLCAMKPYDGPTARVIDREQADRAFDVMLWLRWIGVYVVTKDPVRMRKAAVALARGGDCTAFHRIWRPGAKVHRQAVANFRDQLAGHILEGLRRDLGVQPLSGGLFTAQPLTPRFRETTRMSEAAHA